jgi:glycerol-3-phosphate acyltransferase PlsY
MDPLIPSNTHMSWLLFALASYVLCSIPFGRLISKKIADIDITQEGSRNVGATNVARIIGFKWGILTLLLDTLKGFIPVFLFKAIFPDFGLGLTVVALASLLGHQFSIFLKLRGGKGVATALGIYLAISPIHTLVVLLFFVIVVYIFDFVSLGSILSAALMPLLLLFSGEPKVNVLTSLVMAVLIWVKHKENIRRLFKKEEIRWRTPASPSEDQGDDPVRRRNKNE